MMICIILLALVACGAARVNTGCDTKADITFLVDDSDSVGRDNFHKELGFISDVADKLLIGPDKVQISAVTFGTMVINQVFLGQYKDRPALQNAINGMTFKGGRARIADAIRFTRNMSFVASSGGRSNATHVVVLLTNQPSGTMDMTKLESQTARDDGIVLYTVGVGGAVDLNELKVVATDPDTRHMYTAQNFDALKSLSDLLAINLCNELPPASTMLPVPTGCMNKADVVFMVDSSTSVGNTNLHETEHFLKDIISKLDVGQDKVQIGLVQYSNSPSIVMPLGQYQSRMEVMKALESMTYQAGGTNTAAAIQLTASQVLSQNSGARAQVPRIAVLITDGTSSDSAASVAAANMARTQNISIVAVGVGSGADLRLNSIANTPAKDFIFSVHDYKDLDTITDNLIKQMCMVKTTEVSLTTSSGATLPPDPCLDKIAHCEQYGSNVCTDYKTWAAENCARYCRLCTPLYTIAPPTCVDKFQNCTSYSTNDCSKTGSPVQTNCQLFCGLCGANTSLTGYYGRCSYKGKAYNTGETWYDGCDYECFCADGKTGQYNCNNRCPVYHDLPRDCTLVSQPGQCCLQPVCNFSPTINTQTASGRGKTATGIDVCVFKNQQYYQDQFWQDGCDYQCQCKDAKTGLYKCDDLCPTYHSLPPYCHLEQTAGECCTKPVCEFNTQVGSFSGSGAISGNGVGAAPPTLPPCADVISSCGMYPKTMCSDYRDWAAVNCKKYCNLCTDDIPKPGPEDHCIFNGHLYRQGDKWNTSCSTYCTCENAIHGYYRCLDSCPLYNNLPRGCRTVSLAGECCPVVQCDTGYFLSSSTNLKTIGNGATILVKNPPAGWAQLQPMTSAGEVLTPGTGTSGFTAPSLGGCLYKGQLYHQDQAWEDDCQFMCICKDAGTGLYTCKDRCPSYPLLSPSCLIKPDNNDACCKAPVCTKDLITHQIPVPLPVFQPATHKHSPVAPPTSQHEVAYNRTMTLFPTGYTPPPPTAGSFGHNISGSCLYGEKTYLQGQVWEDGCEFNCICDDASKGHYTCIEKCVHYNALPTSCQLIQDPGNPCCSIPVCPFIANYFTAVGQMATSTAAPRGDFCLYDGQRYREGQTWYDGCRYRCICEDAIDNKYQCLSRCPEYENVAANCIFVADPRDPSCCLMPQCPAATVGPNVTGTTSMMVPSPAPTGTYIGQGSSTGHCDYKGVQYGQGETWTDGCDLSCRCTDAESGFFRCTSLCPEYPFDLPEYCVMITDFRNPCCKVPSCIFPNSHGSVSGTGAPTTTLAPTPTRLGQTPATVGGTTGAPHYRYCLYKNVQYQQGQAWEDGCHVRCRCDNADKGLYICNERCATYTDIPEYCTFVTDPDDSCCVVPSCQPLIPTLPPGVPTPAPGVPTPAPGGPTLAPGGPTPAPGGPTPAPGGPTPAPGGPTPAPGGPTPAPGVPTPAPGGPTPAPNGPYKIPTAAPGVIKGSAHVPTGYSISACEYKGQQYIQGQKWNDGCQLTCECLDASTGKYECIERCTRYVNLPSYCHLKKDPANPCCHVPECLPTPAPVGTSAPTAAPVPLKDVCVYKGKSYAQGQTWYDGCDFVCMCEDQTKGLYTCNNRCPRYGQLPAYCSLVPSSSDPLCCKEPVCTIQNTGNQTSGYLTPPSPPAGVIIGGAATPTPRPSYIGNTPFPGYMSTQSPTPYPGYMSTQSPTPYPGYVSTQSPTPYPGYVSTQRPTPYPGYVSTQSPTPYPGYVSTQSPTPYPGYVSTQSPTPYPGYVSTQSPTPYPGYVSTQRPTPYPGYVSSQSPTPYPGYVSTQSPTPYPGYVSTQSPTPYPGYVSTQSPTPYPGYVSTQSPTPYPGYVSTQSPTPYPGYVSTQSPTPFPGPTQGNTPLPTESMCLYQGKAYTQGQKWRDGCNYNCVCEDARSGQYKCTEMCTRYDNLPAGTMLVTDPYNPCCKKAYIPASLVPTPAPPGASTQNPSPQSPAGCVYNGIKFSEGQKWNDGCDMQCVCDNATTGFYSCRDRCSTFDLIDGCTFITDPRDSCCKIPHCPPVPTPTPGPAGITYQVPTMKPGSFQGAGVGHNGSSPGCVYNGVTYKQGQAWSDGCKYNCTCVDEHSGFYRCIERCQPDMPSTHCQRMADPKDSCCTIPICIYSSPTPGPLQTMAPNSSSMPTPKPKDGVCMMDGVQYLTGQTWNKGCDRSCVCEEGKTGFYRCFDRCAKFTSLPPNCILVPDPHDPTCCMVPDCTPRPGPGQTLPTDKTFTIAGVTGLIQGTGIVPTSITGGLTSSRNSCVYNGRVYGQGQKWQDGCHYNCACTDAATGRYECIERCATFAYIPPQCTMKRSPDDVCCFVPNCNYSIPEPAPFPQPTPQPGVMTTQKPGVTPTPGPGVMPTQKPGVTPTPGPGVTPTPGPGVTPTPGQGITPTPGSGVTPTHPDVTTISPLPIQSYCVYNGVPFRQGQTWNDGCKQQCRCDSAMQNLYSCFDRCRSYNPVPGCTLVSDPDDPCCQVPKCSRVPAPGTPTTCPYPMPAGVSGVITGALQSIDNLPSSGQCVYKGAAYKQGETWKDGCSYNCSCEDGRRGQYKCQERCPRYVDLPASCRMVPDPDDNCCTKPVCDGCTSTDGSTPAPGFTKIPDPKKTDQCVMNGQHYSEGQKWYVGCDKSCVCNDGKTGAYSCIQRCPVYENTAGCTLVPDPADPVCCQAPSCPGITGVFGTINGTGTIPPPTTGATVTGTGPTIATTPVPKVCVYNGKSYLQGQKWQDGCSYDCECLNAETGDYKCLDRCPRFPNLPPSCTLVYDAANPCCQKPQCHDATPAPPQGPTASPQPIQVLTPSPNFCLYQGIPLRQGQRFNDGCDKVCTCDDAKTGRITCIDRCQSYPTLEPNCSMIMDPHDQCCQIPSCPLNPTSQTQTGAYSSFTGFNLPYSKNNPYTGATGTRDQCVYKGALYNQGVTWEDGCSYSCQCLDAAKGLYRCTDKCMKFPPLPSYCRMIQDPNNTCCQTPYCTPPVHNQPTPDPSGNPTPRPDICMYKGSAYVQGQQWNDGCDYICRCENSSINFYSCQQRCATFTQAKVGCTLVPDPKDPTCCEIPSCPVTPPVGPTPTPGVLVGPNPSGVVYGYGPGYGPGVSTGATNSTGYRNGCLYKGMVFHKGARFDDGCTYQCECLDDATGKYRCVEKCQTYPSMPEHCVLIQDQNNPCCHVPYCNFRPGATLPTPGPLITPTPAPGVVTAAPYMTPTLPYINPVPTSSVTPSPTPQPAGYCVYQGVYYTQGQTWDDGCQRRCRCEEASSGVYTCSQRCPSYPVSSCPMRADSQDPCCLVPDCNTGNIPTPIPNPSPALNATNPTALLVPVLGTFTGSSGGRSWYQQGLGNFGNRNACVYKSVIYTQGQTWQDGCSYTCSCIDASIGQYSCTDRCGRYPNLPSHCQYQQSPTDACCREPVCHTYLQPNQTAVLGQVSDKCVYTDGSQYAKGATWTVNCSITCVCNDPAANSFKCTDRCPIYASLPAICTLVTDPDDICCRKAQCSLPGGITLTPLTGNGPTGTRNGTASLEVIPLGSQTMFTGYGRLNATDITGKGVGCVYKGVVYNAAQTWDDGCDYNCTCVNGQTGMYTCSARCPAYPVLPSYCKAASVPGQCCKSIYCDLPGYGSYVPGLTGTSKYPGDGYYLVNATNPEILGNIRDKCLYKSRLYSQGESWEDGCSYSCECLDARTGYYYCKPICPVYSNLPSNRCFMKRVVDQCCAEPRCIDKTSGLAVDPLTSNSFQVVAAYSGGFSGFRPGFFTPGWTNSTTAQGKACLYKGKVYRQGDTWQDGCDFDCSCIDEAKGMYQCTQKCSSYTSLPSSCRLEPVNGRCCKKLTCDSLIPTGVTPPTRPPIDKVCYDQIDNCKDYYQVCSSRYETWARRNCNAFCHYCNVTAPPAPQCEDQLSDCANYQSSCTGIYQEWARLKCAKFCGFCNSTDSSSHPTTTAATATTTMSMTTAPCSDVLDTCNLLDKAYYCVGSFKGWAIENCRKTCNLCNETSITTVASTTPATSTYQPQSTSGTTHAPNEVCNYNGKYYTQGQHWQDGCSFGCVCDDASVGFYKCSDLCPQYTALPDGCSLIKKPGECCGVPNCLTTASPNISRTPDAKCVHNGVFYSQGQTWSDGCSSSCTCTDESQGISTCRGLCLNWQLPPSCHMDDAPPGLCCQQPKCPSNVILTVAKGYEAQYPNINGGF